MLKNYKKGFTLIELLVVIAIIGILSSVVLASLNSARNKGADSAIIQDLGGIKTEAEIFMANNNNTYGAVSSDCVTVDSLFKDAKIESQISDAKTKSGNLDNACKSVDNDSDNFADTWAVAQTLKSDATKAWCVDSANATKTYTITTGQTVANAITAGGACN